MTGCVVFHIQWLAHIALLLLLLVQIAHKEKKAFSVLKEYIDHDAGQGKVPSLRGVGENPHRSRLVCGQACILS